MSLRERRLLRGIRRSFDLFPHSFRLWKYDYDLSAICLSYFSGIKYRVNRISTQSSHKSRFNCSRPRIISRKIDYIRRDQEFTSGNSWTFSPCCPLAEEPYRKFLTQSSRNGSGHKYVWRKEPVTWSKFRFVIKVASTNRNEIRIPVFRCLRKKTDEDDEVKRRLTSKVKL